MEDWRSKLEGLQKGLTAKEQAEAKTKADVLATFRKRLVDLQAVLKDAETFADAFGVEFDFEVTRFDERYPAVRYRIKKPLLVYVCECKEGAVYERMKRGEEKPTVREVTLDAVAPKAFGAQLNKWLQEAADANRKLPGRR